MTHYTRQAILDAMAGRDRISIPLRDGDTAWKPGYVDGASERFTLWGPAAVTYATTHASPGYRIAAVDFPADSDDPRCPAVDASGDQCRLIDGDHPDAHLYGQDDEL